MEFQTNSGGHPQIKFFKQSLEGNFDLWRQETSSLFDTKPVASPRNSGVFKATGFVSDRGVLLATSYDSHALRITKQSASTFGNLIFVQRFRSGGTIGRTDDFAFAHRPGDISIIDHGRCCEGLHQASELQGVHLQKSTLGLDDSAPIPQRDFRSGTVMARLLGDEMDRLFDPLNQNHAGVGADIFERFVSCVKLAVQARPEKGDVRTHARRALRDLISAYIERNLTAPDLSTKSLLHEFGVSRASLYRIFESENGVRNYIKSRRLFRAVFELTTSPPRRGLIREVAERWGFTSDADFSRSVRRVFGASPGSLCHALGDNHETSSVIGFQRAGQLTEISGIKSLARADMAPV